MYKEASDPPPVQICWRCGGPIYNGDTVKFYYSEEIESWLFCHWFMSACDAVRESEKEFVTGVGIEI